MCSITIVKKLCHCAPRRGAVIIDSVAAWRASRTSLPQWRLDEQTWCPEEHSGVTRIDGVMGRRMTVPRPQRSSRGTVDEQTCWDAAAEEQSGDNR